jgi:SAM-dependent methyltransferase
LIYIVEVKPISKTIFQYSGHELEAMSLAVRYHRWILNECKAFIRGEVAEVGAGQGDFSRWLMTLDINRLTAYEPSPDLAGILRTSGFPRRRFRVVQDVFSHRTVRQAFHTVIYVNVLEHIAQDGEELRFVYDTLKPSGHCIVYSPACPALMSEFDRQMGHVRRYTRHGLKSLFESAGFQVVKLRYMDMPGALLWFLNFRLLKRTLTRDYVAVYDRLAVPVIRRVEHLLLPPVGKNVLIVGEKSKRNVEC